MKRMPAVAGSFYPSDPVVLRQQVEGYLDPGARKQEAIGLVSPHAGFMYSGAVAGATFSAVELPDVFIILCPNHRGWGAPIAIMSRGEWVTPLGEVAIDSDLAESLKKSSTLLKEDDLAHRAEHSLEVQLPFLQVLKDRFRFVPICVAVHRLESLVSLGHSIAEVVKASGRKTLLVASSDMTHYEPQDVTEKKDAMAIEQIEKLSEEGLFDVVARREISMCGVAPAIAVMTAAKDLGATRGVLVKYATSGDVTGDKREVVGYAGIIML
jgi:AmmeMemoRadiSam system protein B